MLTNPTKKKKMNTWIRLRGKSARKAPVTPAIEPLADETDLIHAQTLKAIVLLRLDRIAEAEPVIRQLRSTTAWDRSLRTLAGEKGLDVPVDD